MALDDIGNVSVGVEVDGSKFLLQLKALGKSAETLMNRSGSRIGKALGSAFSGDAQKNVDKLGDKISGLALGPMQLLIAAAPLITSSLSALAGTVVALGGSMLRAASSSLSLAGIYGTLGQVVLVTTLAFGGMGKAIAGDEEAMKKLAPSAQAAAKAITGLGDQWTGLRRAIQGAVFKGLADDITAVGHTLMNVARPALVQTGSILNTTFASLAKFAQSESFVKRFGMALQGNNKIFATLASVAKPVLDGLLSVYIALQPAAQRTAGAIARGAQAFRDWATAPGTVQKIRDFMVDAQHSMLLWWRVIKNVGRALFNVFSAGANAGDGLIKKLGEITGKFADWTGSIQGQNAIGDWVDKGVSAFQTFVGIIAKVAALLAPLFNPQLAGTAFTMFEQAMPAIQAIVGALQSALLPIFQKVGQALAENGPAIAKLFIALSPLLKGIGAVLGEIISQALDMIGLVAKIITPVVALIANVLGPVLVKFAPIIAALILAFTNWGSTLVRLIPYIGKFAGPIVKLAEKLISFVGPAVRAVGRIVGSVFRGMGTVIGATMRGASRIIETVWKGVKSTVTTVARAVGRVVETAWNTIKTVTGTAFRAAQRVVETVWGQIKSFVTGAINGVKSAVEGIKVVETTVRNAFTKAYNAVKEMVGKIVRFVAGLPAKAKNALGNIAGALYNAGHDLIMGMVHGVQDAAHALGDAAVAAVKNALSAAKKWAHMGSPSQRAADEIGKPLAEGMAKGVKDAEDKTAAEMTGSVKKIFKKLKANIDAANPTDFLDKVRDQIATALDNKDITKKAAQHMTAMANAQQTVINKMTRKLETYRADLETMKGQWQDMFSSISDTLTGELDLGSMTETVKQLNAETGEMEDVDIGPTAASVGAGVSALAARITAFSAKLRELIAAGVPKELVREVAMLGSEKGLAVANAILAMSQEQLGQLKSDFSAITTAAEGAGTFMADEFFKAGIDAQQGLIDGILNDDDGKIQKAAEKLAHQLTQAIKKALKINSPSALIASEVGVPVGEGVGVGALAGMSNMQRAVNGAAASLISVPTGARSTTVGISQADLARLAAAVGPRGGNANIAVHLPTGDPQAAAQAVMNRLAAAGAW